MVYRIIDKTDTSAKHLARLEEDEIYDALRDKTLDLLM